MNEFFLKYARKYRHKFLEKATLINCFMSSDIPIIELTIDDMKLISKNGVIPYNDSDDIDFGTIVKIEHDSKFAFAYIDDDEIVAIPTSSDVPFDLYDMITIKTGDIENYSGKPLETSIGRYLTNYILSASIFGSTIPYINENWHIGKFEEIIADGLLGDIITMDQYKKYIDHGFWLGHFSELCVPTLSEKSFTTDPNIKKRRDELLEQYKDQLDDPIIIDKIEAELLKMDKEWIDGDSSQGFIEGVNAGKAYGVHRKKMFLTVGGVESFSDGASDYNLIKNSLVEGWDKEDFDIIANDIRKGSYARGKETAKGGALTKFILRVFQDLVVSADDCGTKRGLKLDGPNLLSKESVHNYIGRTVVGKGLITEENINEFVGVPLKLRSPMYCETPDGLCYTCVGAKFRKLGHKALGISAVDVSSTFMLLSMKSMHGSKIETSEVKFVEHFRTSD